MDRRKISTVVRVAGSAVMLAVLLPRLRLSALVPQWRPATAAWLGGALLVTLAGIVVSALRWQRVLAALGVRAGMPSLVNHYLAGLFVGNFLPSTIGGDVLRVSRLSAAVGEPPKTFASVVLERLTGWLVLPVISLAALVINPGLLRLGMASRLAVAVALGTLFLLVALLAAGASPRVAGRWTATRGWLRFVAAVHLGLDRFRRHPAAAAEVLAVGFGYQLVVMLSAFLAGKALGLPISWTAVLAFMPAVAIVQVLPISLGGLGAREAALVLFLHPLGVSTEQAVALGLLVYAVNLTVSLLGAPAFAAGSRRIVPAGPSGPGGAAPGALA